MSVVAAVGAPSLVPPTASYSLLADPGPSRAMVDDARCSYASTCPNILLVLTDDHGQTDLGVTGIDAIVDTPILDRLAGNGARFQFGYASAPQCVPSRAGLLSGRNQNTFGLFENDADAGYGVGVLPPRSNVTTIGERLQGLGYVTGMSGKWHLGSDDSHRQNPGGRGFDEYFVGMVGVFRTNVAPSGRRRATMVEVRNASNRIDLSADFAEHFVMRNRKERFFYYWAPLGPHEPMLEDHDPWVRAFPKPHNAWYTAEENDRRHRGLAAIKAIDTRLGGLLDELRRHKLEEKTLVLFSSDNGAPLSLSYDATHGFTRVGSGGESSYCGSDNVPLRGAKGFLWEGGIRVPMLAYWKGTIAGDQLIREPVTALDFTATIAHAAGISLMVRVRGEFDGQSLLPRLVGDSPVVARPGDVLTHYWTSKTGDVAVRHGDWKLRRCRTASIKLIYLFNITADPLELNNLALQNANVLAQLTSLLDDWEADLPFAVSCRLDGDHGKIFIRKPGQKCKAVHTDPRFVVGANTTCYPAALT